MTSLNDRQTVTKERSWSVFAIDVGLVFLLFFVLGANPAPEVNEAHYLAKARHFWSPEWAGPDHFLNSADAHLLFYWVFGWLTQVVSLTATAWIGRSVTWILLAVAWCRLSWTLLPFRLAAVLTAGLFVGLLDNFHLAGEWVIGGVEAKGLAYALLLFALSEMIEGRWWRVWLLLGACSSFHVLVGGWAVICTLPVWFCYDRGRFPVSQAIPALVLGGLLALPGLWAGVQLNWGLEPSEAAAANRIYVFERLPHHLVFHRLPFLFRFRFGALSALFILLSCVTWNDDRYRRVNSFVIGSLFLCGTGILIDYGTWRMPDLSASLLRYYWFRLSDAMVPLGVAFGATLVVARNWSSRQRLAELQIAGLILLVSLHVARVYWARTVDPRPRAVSQSLPRGESLELRDRRFEDWKNVCRWVDQNTATDAIFLTPRLQQGFKWYSGRAEVANWKDIPQNARSILEWRQRMAAAYPRSIVWKGLTAHSTESLERLAHEYGFEYIIIDRSRSSGELPFLKVYPATSATGTFYEVYPPAGSC